MTITLSSTVMEGELRWRMGVWFIAIAIPVAGCYTSIQRELLPLNLPLKLLESYLGNRRSKTAFKQGRTVICNSAL